MPAQVAALDHKKEEMKKYIPYLIMFLVIVLDATGDGFRTLGMQKAHHVLEASWIVLFFTAWALSKFKWQYALTFVLCRIWAFNFIYNLVAGNKFGYLSDGNYYDDFLIWVGHAVKQDPIHFYIIFSLMAFAASASLIVKEYRK